MSLVFFVYQNTLDSPQSPWQTFISGNRWMSLDCKIESLCLTDTSHECYKDTGYFICIITRIMSISVKTGLNEISSSNAIKKKYFIVMDLSQDWRKHYRCTASCGHIVTNLKKIEKYKEIPGVTLCSTLNWRS